MPISSKNITLFTESLSTRLLVRILIFSSIFTAITTFGQLYIDYQSERATIKDRADLVSEQYIFQLTNVLWQVDSEQVHVMLNSILSLPDVTYVELNDATLSSNSVVLGNRLVDSSDLITYPLIFKNKSNHSIHLGTLKVEFTYTRIIERLIKTLLFVFSFQLFKAVSISLFIFLIIKKFILERITTIVNYLNSIELGNLALPLNESDLQVGKGRDELDGVGTSVNLMRKKLVQESKGHIVTRELLANSELRLRSTLNSLSEGVISYDQDDRVISMNAAAEGLTGWSEQDALGKQVQDVFKYELEPNDGASKNNPSFVEVAGELTSREGNQMLVSCDKSTIYLDETTALGTVMVFRDVTQELQIRRAFHRNDKLRALGQLSSGIAHDLNNILTVILSAAELLVGQNTLLPEQKKLISLIINTTDQGGQTIKRLLTYSNVGAIKREPFDLHKVMDNVTEMLRQGGIKDILIKMKTNAQVHIVNGDSSGIEGALMNLGINSIHALQSGGQLTFSTEHKSMGPDDCVGEFAAIAPGEYISLEVSDTGSGIHAKDIKFIFEPFFSTKNKSEGAGLGLWNVYSVISQHEGLITVKSRIGNGTTFQILLPLSNSKINAIEEPILENGNGVTVLFVDDNLAFLKLGEMVIQSLGYDVVTASSGEEAIEIFASDPEKFDLVILDNLMPSMSGPETLPYLRALNPDFHVVFSSGYVEENPHEAFENASFVQKPYRRQQLAKVLDEITKMQN